ncbi:MAG: VOC family protein [Oscillospiraceae bacterium]|jgi:catechol 2,3-dioxygenase-like lactoylglutathione lyase family enzyme|nr:VOC family protein [Oscillospiraceae bacterium]
MGRGLDHICVVSDNLDKSVDFYTRVLGFEFVMREELASQGIEIARVMYKGDVVEFVRHTDRQAPRGAGDGAIELIGIAVPDVRAGAARLRELGVECLMDEPVEMPGGGFFFFRGPSGEKLELVQTDGE